MSSGYVLIFLLAGLVVIGMFILGASVLGK